MSATFAYKFPTFSGVCALSYLYVGMIGVSLIQISSASHFLGNANFLCALNNRAR